MPHAWEPVWPSPVASLQPPSVDARATARVDELAARFDLTRWKGLLEEQDLRESLYVLDVLDRLVLHHLPAVPALRALDVGSKNGCYLPGLVASTAATGGTWHAVEVDAHRRYADLSTRRTHALRLLRGLGGAHQFLCGAVEDPALAGLASYHLATWFLPFLTPGPARAWGLPSRLHQPSVTLSSVRARLAPGGIMLIVNQGETEHASQCALLTSQGARFDDVGPIESVLSPFRKPRWGVLVHA